MSTLAGVFLRDGSPAAEREASIRAALSPFSIDGVSMHTRDSIVMGCAECRAWSDEEGTATFRLRSRSGLVATWDGRLDNRDDLRLRLGLGAVFGAVVVWVSQLRPRVTAYTRDLHLKGSLRDARVPYVLIDEVTMAQTLNVWAGGRRFMCIGIGKSLGSDIRQRAKKERQGSLLGTSRSREFSERAEVAAPDQTAMSYHTFVVTRIEELVDQAKRELRRRGESTEGLAVSRPYAVPEIVALTVTGVAFVVSLLV